MGIAALTRLARSGSGTYTYPPTGEEFTAVTKITGADHAKPPQPASTREQLARETGHRQRATEEE